MSLLFAAPHESAKAQSGHPDALNQCLLSGVKRTSQFDRAMSGFDPQQTLGRTPHPYPNRRVQKTLQMR